MMKIDAQDAVNALPPVPMALLAIMQNKPMPLNVTCAHIDALKATGLLAPLYAPQQLSNLVIEMTISRKQKQTAGMY